MFVVFFAFEEFFLTGIALTSVERWSTIYATSIVNENKPLAAAGEVWPTPRLKINCGLVRN
jgi:hypothetical protein